MTAASPTPRRRKSLGTVIEDLHQEDIDPSFFATEVFVGVLHDHTLHANYLPCLRGKESWNRRSRYGAVTQVSLDRVTSYELCAGCLSGDQLRPALRDAGALARAHDQVALRNRLTKLRDKGESGPAVATLVTRYLKKDRGAWSADLDPRLAGVCAQVGALLDELEQRVKTTDTLKDQLLEAIGRTIGARGPLDPTPALVGFGTRHRYPKRNDLANDVLTTFALDANKDNLVVLVPRYVADYLIAANEYSGDKAPTTAIVPDTTDVIETAAALWDPTATGQCATVYGALVAARAALSAA